MNEFENNYEMMADSLQVMNKRLYLLNPKYIASQKNDTKEGINNAINVIEENLETDPKQEL